MNRALERSVTLDQRIRGAIEERIRSGEWAPGHRIPFEHELVSRYACARATVSKALSALVRDGLIERRRRAGSFVARPSIEQAVMEIEDFAATASTAGSRYVFRLLDRRVVGPAAAANMALRVKGLHLLDDQPVAYEIRDIFLHTVPQAAVESFDKEAPGSWLLRYVPWSDAEHVIGAKIADAKQAALLEIERGAACLTLERKTSRQGQAITAVQLIYAAERYRFRGRFTPRRQL